MLTFTSIMLRLRYLSHEKSPFCLTDKRGFFNDIRSLRSRMVCLSGHDRSIFRRKKRISAQERESHNKHALGEIYIKIMNIQHKNTENCPGTLEYVTIFTIVITKWI